MTKKQTFENALVKLEEIARNLESGDVPLEESLKYYAEAMKLIEFCNNKLNEAHKKIQKLSRSKNGDFELEAFEGSGEE
jgi:exodeoxyribonuclease VII small subunit